MKLLDRIFNKMGYIPKKVYTPVLDKVRQSEKPYEHMAVWYNMYNYITEKNLPPKDTDAYKQLASHSFSLDPVEQLRYNEFIDKHVKTCKGKLDFGNSVSFEGTGIGYVVKCHCNKCGQAYDITNINSW